MSANDPRLHPPAPPHVSTDARRSAEIRAVSEREWSLRVTIDPACKADLETLASLLSHKAGPDLAAVLHEAIRCGIEKHGKRKGAVEPGRARSSTRHDAPPSAGSRMIPIAVRREVWKRDGGCCTWRGTDGRRCGSRWKVEIDHITPVARGGTSDVGNLRLLCARHNAFYAEQVYGREHMERFRRAPGAPTEADGSEGADPGVGLYVREPPALAWGEAA